MSSPSAPRIGRACSRRMSCSPKRGGRGVSAVVMFANGRNSSFACGDCMKKRRNGHDFDMSPIHSNTDSNTRSIPPSLGIRSLTL